MARINAKVVSKIPLVKTRNAILDALANHLNVKLKGLYTGLRALVRELIYEIISLSPEAAELRDGGTLAAQFGIPLGRGNSVVARLARRVSNSALVRIYKVTKKRGQISGRIKIGIIKSDYSDVLGMRAAVQPVDGGELPWLDWLLREGDKIFVKEYGIKFKKAPTSRSGEAIMIKLTDKFVRPFRITPTNFTGTEDDNWFTRAMELRANYFFGQINEYIKRNI